MSELKVGDNVFVKNWGDKYPVCEEWFLRNMRKNEFDDRWAIRFAYDVTGVVAPYETRFKILYIDGNKALITKASCTTNPVYLMCMDSLVLARKRMTKAEIERELGYEIEIIGGYDENFK